jgi:hypothetical protein
MLLEKVLLILSIFPIHPPLNKFEDGGVLG